MINNVYQYWVVEARPKVEGRILEKTETMPFFRGLFHASYSMIPSGKWCEFHIEQCQYENQNSCFRPFFYRCCCCCFLLAVRLSLFLSRLENCQWIHFSLFHHSWDTGDIHSIDKIWIFRNKYILRPLSFFFLFRSVWRNLSKINRTWRYMFFFLLFKEKIEAREANKHSPWNEKKVPTCWKFCFLNLHWKKYLFWKEPREK